MLDFFRIAMQGTAYENRDYPCQVASGHRDSCLSDQARVSVNRSRPADWYLNQLDRMREDWVRAGRS